MLQITEEAEELLPVTTELFQDEMSIYIFNYSAMFSECTECVYLIFGKSQ
jgi:hypothetical protein